MSARELPIGRKLGAARIRDEMRLVTGEVHPGGPRYRCLVPREVRIDLPPTPTEELPPQRLTPLAVFSADDLSVPVVHIQAIRPVREIRALHWLQLFAARTDRRLVQMHEVSALFADVLAAFRVADQEALGRAAATVWGDELLLVSTYVRESRYEAWAEKMGAIVSSFRLEGAPAHPTIEPRRTLTLASLVELRVPASWRPLGARDFAPVGEPLTFVNLDDDGVANGAVQVLAIDGAPDLSRLVEQAVGRVRAMGFEPRALEHQAQLPTRTPDLQRADLAVLSGTLGPGSAPQECRICIARGRGFTAVLSLLTPDREAHFAPWAINVRAHEILAESLRPLHPPV